jgi:hypothetical protein
MAGDKGSNPWLLLFLFCLASSIMGQEQKIVDWTNREAGEEQSPQWLKSMTKGNIALVKEKFGFPVNNSVRFSAARGESMNTAQKIAADNFFVDIAGTLSRSFLTFLVIQLDKKTNIDSMMNYINAATWNAMSKSNSKEKDDTNGGLVSPQLALMIDQTWKNTADFWQLTETTLADGSKTRHYTYYGIYTADQNALKSLQSGFMSAVVDSMTEGPQKQAVQKAVTSVK